VLLPKWASPFVDVCPAYSLIDSHSLIEIFPAAGEVLSLWTSGRRWPCEPVLVGISIWPVAYVNGRFLMPVNSVNI